MEAYRVRARNTALDSENRIHEDTTAAAYGFRGGLVPGVTVYGYLTVPVVRHYGEAWLARGGMRVTFLQPFYDGDEVVVELADKLVSACRLDGTPCAKGEVFWTETDAPALSVYAEAPLPAERPPASAVSLTPGRVLGSLHLRASLPDDTFLTMQDEQLPVYREGIMHPAAMLTLSNQLLLQNVKLGPWIHVASEIHNFSLVRDGDAIIVRGRVVERFERKGHQLVVLDIIIVAEGDRVVQQVRHTAIYEPRLRRSQCSENRTVKGL